MNYPVTNPPTTLEKLATYNCWANEILLVCLEEIGENVPATSLQLLSHICNAQMIWINRINKMKSTVRVFEEYSLAGCRSLLDSTSEQLLEMAAMPGKGLLEVITYTNTKGEVFDTAVQDILIHVFNHSTYHRAQIARDLRQNALTPVNTDYITFVRNLAVPDTSLSKQQ